MKTEDSKIKLQQLMVQSQEGDASAYNQLLKEIYPIIQKFLISRLGPLGSDSDLIQECLIAVHKARHTYDSKRSFTNWMFAVVKYKSIDILRKKSKQWAREVHNDEFLATFSDPTSNNKSDHQELVQTALKKLPAEMRRAIELTKLEGLSINEACEKEGISSTALRSRVSRGYKLLRKNLEREKHV